jgi:hypothetical protein
VSNEQTPLVVTCPSLNFTFVEFEVPETLKSLGGEQMSAAHKFPGGRKVIQTFGAFPFDTIDWSGIIQGAGAFQRAILLDSIRQGGIQCALTYGVWKYVGILKQCRIDVRNQAWIPYSVVFEPAEDQSQAGASTATPSQEASFTGLSGGLANQVAVYAGSNPTIEASLGQIISVLGNVQVALNAAGGTLAAIPSSVLAAQSATVTNLISQLAPLADVPAINATANYVAGLTTADSAMSDLLWQQKTVYLLQQLAFLLSVPPLEVNIIEVVNPCLLILASQLYGDPAQWPTLSQANNNFPIFAIGIYSLIAPASPLPGVTG